MSSKSTNPALNSSYTNLQLLLLIFLRVVIGWHFLYEGLAKLLNPYWSSAGYLIESKWIFSGFFKTIAACPPALKTVDFLNTWGLMVIGLALILGVLDRAACLAGAVFLFLYYISTPPFVGYSYSIPQEGSYVIVNKNLVELGALLVLAAFPTGRNIGLERLLFGPSKRLNNR